MPLPATEERMKQSPCTKVCTLDPTRRMCLGCGRTVEEIARWSQLSEDERQRIVADLPTRRARACESGPR